MEKHSYETYEFLATSNPDADPDTNQFFVLQDDGTILTVNKEIQYVTQIEEEKDTIGDGNPTEGCASVFDVSAQQYYVDVEGNNPEIISINDEFSIANEENNVFTNSYLIQPETSLATLEMETEAIIDPQTLDAQQLQQNNVQAFNGNEQTSDFTEITLTDEQYQILEQKGWILMESNNRIFVLNTLGLHDITTNDKLIQQLKSELQNNKDTKGQLRIESVTTILPSESTVEPLPEQSDIVEYLMENNVPVEYVVPGDNIQFINDNADEEMNELEEPEEIKVLEEAPIPDSKLNKSVEENSDIQKKCDSIKIKTKYTFSDIPDKIFLGTTVNGKKLFAKVSKVNKSVYDKKKSNRSEEVVTNFGKKHIAGLDGARFINIIQDSFRDTMAKVNKRDVAAAASVVSQLLRLSNIKDSIIDTHLLITKIMTSATDSGAEVALPTLVTGMVKLQDNEHTFCHNPLMLHQLLDKAEDIKDDKNPSFDTPEERTAKGVIEVFHIHIAETRFPGKSPQTSINLSKRKLALDVLNDARKRHPNPVYACGSCGAVFKSEHPLKDHQNNHCLEVEDELTIDTDDFNDSNETLYSVINVDNDKLMYSCTICGTTYTRLYNCQKHIKAHKTGIEKKLKVYKCKMCPNTYFHSSSLSKHIVKMHIQMKLN